jgi:hypothetical protein
MLTGDTLSEYVDSTILVSKSLLHMFATIPTSCVNISEDQFDT